MRPILLLLSALIMGGCVIGPKAPALAREARGARVTLEAPSRVIAGELLALQDDAIVIREPYRIVRVPFTMVSSGNAEVVGDFYGGSYTDSSPSVRERRLSGTPSRSNVWEKLRQVSRYPQGISPDLERALLAAYQLDRMEVIQP